MKKSGKDLLTGALALALAGFFVKVIGMLYKIPLTNILGDLGMGYFSSAYTVYTVFYMILASGLPIAISLTVSEARAASDIRSERAAYKIAMRLFMTLGALFSALMIVFSKGFADIIKNSGARLSIIFIAPTVFFSSGIGVLRGYFQGKGDMIPTAVSQSIEALGKLFLGLLLLNGAIRLGMDSVKAAAASLLGLTLSTAAAFFYLLIKKRSFFEADYITEKKAELTKKEKKDVLRKILSISVPSAISASVMSLAGAIDLVTVIRMLTKSGMSEEGASALFGNYSSLALPIFSMPGIIITSIVYTFSPRVRECASVGDRRGTVENIDTSIASSLFISLPIALGIAAFPKEILSVIYTDADRVERAAPLLAALSPGIVFLALLSVINGIHQALGRQRYPIIAMIAGALAKTVSSVLLIPRIGIIGASFSTVICYFTALLISLVLLVTSVRYSLPIYNCIVKPSMSALLSVTAVIYLYRVLMARLDDKIAFFIAVLCCVLLYFALYIIMSYRQIGKNSINIICQRIKEKRNERQSKDNDEQRA